MISLKAAEIAHIVDGQLFGENVVVSQAPVLNSSQATSGSIFLSLKGENVDGHDFAEDAI